MAKPEDVAFVAVVLRWVHDKLIDETQAAAILIAFAHGTLSQADLPAPIDAVVHTPTVVEIQASSMDVLGFLQRVFSGKTIKAPNVGPNVELRALSGRVRDDFMGTARELSVNVTRGEMNIAEWEASFADHVAAHILNQHMIGTGSTEILPEALPRLVQEMTRQRAYASRFADQMSIARAEGRPMSEQYIAARSGMYAGAGYAEYWRATEETLLGRDDMTGYVSLYQAYDDPTTCSECADADIQGPYMLNDGPWPGSVCLGRGRCRCERVIVYDPIAYEMLTGQQRERGNDGN